jgi:hypothetical protein
MSDKLLDAAEAAALLGLFNASGKPLKSWVLAEARADRIPHVRLGRYVRFDPDELIAWWKAQRRGPSFLNGAARNRRDARD